MDYAFVGCHAIAYPLQVCHAFYRHHNVCTLIHCHNFREIDFQNCCHLFQSLCYLIVLCIPPSTLYLGKRNLTLMFNSIETKERYEEDAVEHGNQIPLNEDNKSSEKVSYK